MEDKTKEVKEVTDKKPVVKPVEVEVKVLKFKNVTKDMKIKLVEGKTFKWITLKKGESVAIPRKIALRNKLVEVK